MSSKKYIIYFNLSVVLILLGYGVSLLHKYRDISENIFPEQKPLMIEIIESDNMEKIMKLAKLQLNMLETEREKVSSLLNFLTIVLVISIITIILNSFILYKCRDKREQKGSV